MERVYIKYAIVLHKDYTDFRYYVIVPSTRGAQWIRIERMEVKYMVDNKKLSVYKRWNNDIDIVVMMRYIEGK